MALTPEAICHRVETLKRRYAERDARWRDVRSIRANKPWDVAPHMQSEMFPSPITSNFIDTAARDFATSASDLPTFSCSSGGMVTDVAKKRADKRTKIALQYVEHSRLDINMVSVADAYFSYAQPVIRVEADYKSKAPRMLAEDPFGGYADFDRSGRCVSYVKVVKKTISELCALFPESEHIIKSDGDGMDAMWRSGHGGGETQLELVRYTDKDQDILCLPDRKGYVLAQLPNPLGVCPVVVGRRRGDGDDDKGQFDDVVWPQIARNYFAALNIEAADKAVQAPLAVPSDVDEISFGPDALLKTNSPEKVRRVGMDLPQAAFAEMASLADELRKGAAYPEGRTGNMDASVITGQGVEALMGGYNGQIALAQRVFKQMLIEALGLCFMLDEKLWPDREKTISGVQDGTPYQVTYTPSRDIKGDYTVDVQYGMLGMDRNRALVFLLQALGAGLVSKDFVVRQLPFPVDVVQEGQQRDVEGLREALSQGIGQMAMSIPQAAAMGQDPATIVRQIADIVKGRQKGDSLESIVQKVLAPPEQAAPPGADPTAPPGQDPMAALAGNGGGGTPDLQTLMAGLSSGGDPRMSASVVRQSPV